MPDFSTILWVIDGTLLLIGLVLILGALRYRLLAHRIGAFTCDLRRGRQNGREPRRFTPGVASYGAGRLEWYSAFSLSPTPRVTWPRSELTVVTRGPALQRRDETLVRCQCQDSEFDLLMSNSAYAGLASWLEAAPTVEPEII